jgi:ribonuclease HI
MENELLFALELLGLTRKELQLKMLHKNTKTITVYTDGACPNNGFKAQYMSIGIFFGDNDPRNISSKINTTNATNNKAELMAILLTLQTINKEDDVEICSDSQYCINAINKWMSKWKRTNWMLSSGAPVKNQELFLQIDQELEKRIGLTQFRHVSNNNHKKPSNKANKDHYGNYMADKLANDALDEKN